MLVRGRQINSRSGLSLATFRGEKVHCLSLQQPTVGRQGTCLTLQNGERACVHAPVWSSCWRHVTSSQRAIRSRQVESRGGQRAHEADLCACRTVPLHSSQLVAPFPPRLPLLLDTELCASTRQETVLRLWDVTRGKLECAAAETRDREAEMEGLADRHAMELKVGQE